MASFLRSRQAGIGDLSPGITSDLFAPDDQARFGINSQTSCVAYDPVQSLLAIGTCESRFGPGRIYVFGQKRVHRVFDPPRPTSIVSLEFSANRLVSVDAKSEIAVWDLETGNRVAANTIAGGVACSTTDPLLDWAFLGLKTGEVVAYDLDRERLAAQFKLPNFWKVERGTERASSSHGARVGIVSLALHPRDIGQLLIGYTHGTVIYSIKQNKPVKWFEYVLPPGAPGGDGEISAIVRKPTLTHAVWHPMGTFVLTAHEDGSLVFWDPKEEKVLMARTLAELNVDRPVAGTPRQHKTGRIVDVAWCCKQNADDTGLLVAGGQNEDGNDSPALTFIELGPSPIYATSSWQALEGHFAGKRTIQLPLPANPTGFTLVPRTSPYFAGGQDPIAIMVNLSGELITLSFPSGYPISPTNQLHPSVSLIHPYVTRFAVAAVPREKWLGFTEKRTQGEPLLKGGAPGPKPKRRFEDRTILQLAHGDGTIRIWDSGHEDEIENDAQLQVDVARALDRYDAVKVTAMSLSRTTGEFVAGTDRGEVVVYRWGRNQFMGGGEEGPAVEANPGGLVDITSRTEPSLKEGLQPFVLYDSQQGPISAVKASDIGFAAVGTEAGHFALIDLRGPAIFFQATLSEIGKDKRSSFFKHSRPSSSSGTEHATVVEFGIMTLDDDKYSSIACFVGTSTGRVLSLKIVPSGGGHAATLAGVVACEGQVRAVCPVVAETGGVAAATAEGMDGLRGGKTVNGVLVVVTSHEMRIFKPATHKGASKDFDDILCDAAAVTEIETRGHAIVGIFGDRTARAYSIPALKEIGSAQLPMADLSRGPPVVMPTGNLFVWTGPSELAQLDSWAAGRPLRTSNDMLVNMELATPPRPTISNLQWLSGTQYISPADLDLLVGGPDRPPSKRMLAAEAAEKQTVRAAQASHNTQSGENNGEGWGEYFTRQLNERTEKLGIMGDNMDNLANESQGWADDVNKYINKQKRGAAMGYVSGRFF